MKSLTRQTEDKLGFTDIRNWLIENSITDGGKEIAASFTPFHQEKELKAELARVVECRDLLGLEDGIRLLPETHITALWARAEVEGNWLGGEEFAVLLDWLKAAAAVRTFFQNRREKYPALWNLVSRAFVSRDLVKRMEQVVDERGSIRNGASPALSRVRDHKNRAAAEARGILMQILREAISKGYTSENNITIRNDRMVIPISSDFKGRIQGLVHDVSASGQTFFIEPTAAVEYNNLIRQYEAEEKNEIIRILIQLTAELRAEVPALRETTGVLATLDFIRAKGKLALALRAGLPAIRWNAPLMRLIHAYHPLLLLKAGKDRSRIQPVSLELSAERRIILVSGPNAGGKSVSLKTTGLLQLMLQSGLLIPADESSEFRGFRDILIDIGDEQSIASDLSTYTSHLAHMRTMLDEMDSDTLFLIDEFGSGTDPRLGGAMAQAFLEIFLKRGGYGMITTHYGNLKNFAENHEGIMNAAMEFDPIHLSPTFRLQVGTPGRSYAFEIAKKVGIPEDVIESARSNVSQEEVYGEELLLSLEKRRTELEQVLDENQKVNAELRSLMERNRDLKQELEKNRTAILQQARAEAQALLREANRKIENTIREIRESQADKDRTRELRQELAEMLPQEIAREAMAEEEIPFTEPDPEELPGEELQEGDWVKLRTSGTYGKLMEIKDKRGVVVAGDLRVTVKLKDVVKVTPPKTEFHTGYARSVLVEKKARVRHQIDVQGMRVEAVQPEISKFMDDAILAGLKEVRILHGKGTGALRTYIREYLRTLPEVKEFADEHADRGGPGWTIVTLY